MATNIHNKAPFQGLSVCRQQNDQRSVPWTDQGLSEKSSLVEVKNGKLVLRQKPLSLEKVSETMQEIVLFRQMLEQRLEQQEPPLEIIPDRYYPLIAKLVHESDKTFQTLSKHIHHELLPVQLDDEENSNSSTAIALPLHVVEVAIKAVASRVNYGLESDILGAKVPAQMCIWRWEVHQSHYNWLPKSLKGKVEARLNERRQAKKDIVALFESLSSEERAAISSSKVTLPEPTSFPKPMLEENNQVESITLGSRSTDVLADTSPQMCGNEPKKTKILDPEKAAKDKQRQQKRSAKAEKEKRAQESQSKSRNLMTSFFSKPKLADGAAAIPSVTAQTAEASNSKSDFDKSFRSFALKKGVNVAPINLFRDRSRVLHQNNTAFGSHQVIIIDDDQVESPEHSESKDSTEDIVQLHDRARLDQLKSHLRQFSVPGIRHPPHRTSSFKTSSKRSVRAILNELAEAEVSGDTSLVRFLYSLLRNRSIIPAKILIFAEDSRPGYYGTWTKSSTIVGPRTPFARDTVALDYSYDSGEDWEDEDPGEADDVVEDEDDEEQEEGKDSDADSWLVNDDEDVEPETLSEDKDLLSSSGNDFPVSVAANGKRKAVSSKPDNSSKKRRATPLVPFIKGPSWESTIGNSPGTFTPYQIKFFNDAIHPIDPFTYVTPRYEDESRAPADSRFIVPLLPNRVSPSKPNDASSSHPSVALLAMKKSVVPKQPFPDAHVPALLKKITSLGTGSLVLIVEAAYQELKDQKVKKKSIEVKVREVATKENKIWVVKPNLQIPETPS